MDSFNFTFVDHKARKPRSKENHTQTKKNISFSETKDDIWGLILKHISPEETDKIYFFLSPCVLWFWIYFLESLTHPICQSMPCYWNSLNWYCLVKKDPLFCYPPPPRFIEIYVWYLKSFCNTWRNFFNNSRRYRNNWLTILNMICVKNAKSKSSTRSTPATDQNSRGGMCHLSKIYHFFYQKITEK